MGNPLISIIIPAYNAAATLAATCASVANQTFSDWECLLVDDGSTDATASLAAKITEENAKFRYIYQDNQGVSSARNAGIAAARGEFIAFLDADDLWLPDSLALFAAAFTGNPQLDFVWGRMVRFTEDGRIKPLAWKNYLETDILWHDLMVHYFLQLGCVCLRRSALPSPPYFDCGLTHGEDRDFLLRVVKSVRSKALDHEVLLYRLHGASASSNAQRAIEGETRSMRRHLDDPDLPAVIRKRAVSALAFRCAVIAGFVARDWLSAMSWYAKAVLRDPCNINNYLLPLHKFRLCLFPPPARHIREYKGIVYE